jgi:hypothetical protein
MGNGLKERVRCIDSLSFSAADEDQRMYHYSRIKHEGRRT